MQIDKILINSCESVHTTLGDMDVPPPAFAERTPGRHLAQRVMQPLGMFLELIDPTDGIRTRMNSAETWFSWQLHLVCDAAGVPAAFELLPAR